MQTDVLGIGIDSSLKTAHAALDSLCDAAHRPKEADDAEGDQREHQVLWTLAKTVFASVDVKADDKERITYVAASCGLAKKSIR